MTNSLAAALIDQVQHNCKFSDQGCGVKMMLKDLLVHEKKCPERTIKCPYSGCAHIVKLKNFDSHALDKPYCHSKIIRGIMLFRIQENNVVYRQNWHMGCIHALDELFYVNLAYHEPSNCFVFSIWLARSQNEASKYIANLVINGDNSKLCFDGLKVISVENVPSIAKCIEDAENISLCLPRSLAKNISVKKKLDTDFGIAETLKVQVSFMKI